MRKGFRDATARLLAAADARLFAAAPRTDRLKAPANDMTAGGKICIRPLNVTRLDDMRGFADFAVAEFGRIEAVVNSAVAMF